MPDWKRDGTSDMPVLVPPDEPQQEQTAEHPHLLAEPGPESKPAASKRKTSEQPARRKPGAKKED
jgi:hypothetical protein